MKKTKSLTRKPKLLLQRDVVRVLETHDLQNAQGGGLHKVLETTGSDQVCCA
jgi:hypothetical protein